MCINLKYYNIGNNIGDALNPLLFNFLFNLNINTIKLTTLTTNKSILGVGSILKHCTNNTIICGSGFISEFDECKNITDFSSVCVPLIRGPLSKHKLQQIGIKCDYTTIYCDMGILYPSIFQIPKQIKRYEYGIIPHYIDKNIAHQIFNNQLIIDIEGDPKRIITQILQCNKIISSSLHGIIISEALKIPAAWIELSNNVLGNGFKFYDYYFGTNRFNIKRQKIIHINDLQHIIFQPLPHFNFKRILTHLPYTISTNIYNTIINYYESI